MAVIPFVVPDLVAVLNEIPLLGLPPLMSGLDFAPSYFRHFLRLLQVVNFSKQIIVSETITSGGRKATVQESRKPALQASLMAMPIEQILRRSEELDDTIVQLLDLDNYPVYGEDAPRMGLSVTAASLAKAHARALRNLVAGGFELRDPRNFQTYMTEVSM